MNFAYSSKFVPVNRVCCGGSYSFHKSPSCLEIHVCEFFSDPMTEQKFSIVAHTKSLTFIVIIFGATTVHRITCKVHSRCKNNGPDV